MGWPREVEACRPAHLRHPYLSALYLFAVFPICGLPPTLPGARFDIGPFFKREAIPGRGATCLAEEPTAFKPVCQAETAIRKPQERWHIVACRAVAWLAVRRAEHGTPGLERTIHGLETRFANPYSRSDPKGSHAAGPPHIDRAVEPVQPGVRVVTGAVRQGE